LDIAPLARVLRSPFSLTLLPVQNLFKFRIQSIPYIVAILLLLVLVRRSQQNWQNLSTFVEDRKYYDLKALTNGLYYLNKPPIKRKDAIKDAVANLVSGAHRNTLFILGESQDAPEIFVQPVNKFSEEEVKKAVELWFEGANYNKIYSKEGMQYSFTQKGINFPQSYHLIATKSQINGIKLDVLAFTAVSRTVKAPYNQTVSELSILLSAVGFVMVGGLFLISKSVSGHDKDISNKRRSDIKWWWPQEIKSTAENYNNFLLSETLYKIQIDQSTSGQMIVRSHGMETAILCNPNKALANISGYTQDELDGQPLNMIVPEEYHHFHQGLGVYAQEVGRRVGMAAYAEGCPFYGKQASRIVGRNRTVDLLHKDGSIRKVVLGVFYVGKNEGGFDEWVGVVTDVTDLTNAIIKAEAFAKDTQNITHIFAHDLKAGEIASAKAGEYVSETGRDLLEYLETEGKLDKSSRRSLEFIIKYSGRITASCQNNFALIDQRNKLHDLEERITPQPEPIEKILDGINVSFTRSDGKLVLTNNCPDGTKAFVDIALFLSALKNLVKNGFTHNESSSKHVEVIVSVKNNAISFAIVDNGVGFPPEYLLSWGRIQGQAARLSAEREGSGTGLFSVRRIIEVHKGATVEILSKEGVGSTFLITVGIGL
jgi:anti-sigma regulatory factor (Ser/Thr protein kinase)